LKAGAVVLSGLAIGSVLLLALSKKAEAAPVEFVCPLCGEKFATYEELYQHFTGEHPAEPIDIIWE